MGPASGGAGIRSEPLLRAVLSCPSGQCPPSSLSAGALPCSPLRVEIEAVQQGAVRQRIKLLRTVPVVGATCCSLLQPGGPLEGSRFPLLILDGGSPLPSLMPSSHITPSRRVPMQCRTDLASSLCRGHPADRATQPGAHLEGGCKVTRAAIIPPPLAHLPPACPTCMFGAPRCRPASLLLTWPACPVHHTHSLAAPPSVSQLPCFCWRSLPAPSRHRGSSIGLGPFRAWCRALQWDP